VVVPVVVVSEIQVWIPGEPVTMPAVPSRTAVRTVAPARGFPRSAVPVQEWVPGVSRPDGALLAGAAGATVGVAVLGGESVARAVGAVTSGVIVLVSAAIPTAAMWWGASLSGGTTQ
jgi:hypothetical protein